MRKRMALALAIGAMLALPANASAQRPTDPPATTGPVSAVFHSSVASPDLQNSFHSLRTSFSHSVGRPL